MLQLSKPHSGFGNSDRILYLNPFGLLQLVFPESFLRCAVVKVRLLVSFANPEDDTEFFARKENEVSF